MIRLYFLATLLVVLFSAKANYTTPGTGQRWNLAQLAANSGGDITQTGGAYLVNDTITISNNDTLYIFTNETVKFIQGSFLSVKGVLLVNPPLEVLFTAQNTSAPFLGVWIDLNSGSVLRKLTLEYANSLRLSDCSPKIDSCTFRYNSPLSNFGNAAISLFRSSPQITNCRFTDNLRAAIQGGANINNAPYVYNCYFKGNNSTNQNVPQINLGPSGSDTTKIISNQFLDASTMSGGIGFLPLGNLNALIKNNIIRNNRYGITLLGGNNINCLISYNVIENNNTGANPLTGGSGIAFAGGTATSRQKSIVTGNYIAGNLWGITIQNRAQPNLGNLSNADTTDDGKNYFYNNTNTATPNIDLYNNTPDTIYAQGNYWFTADSATVETKVFHTLDQSSLGPVLFMPIKKPVSIINFTATVVNHRSALSWQSSGEFNTQYYIVQKSMDGSTFNNLDTVLATNLATYTYFDEPIPVNQKIYYRIMVVGKYGITALSEVKWVEDVVTDFTFTGIYPTLLSSQTPLTFYYLSPDSRPFDIALYSMDGRLLWKQRSSSSPGLGNIVVTPAHRIAAGIVIVKITGKDIDKTFRVLYR